LIDVFLGGRAPEDEQMTGSGRWREGSLRRILGLYSLWCAAAREGV